MQERRQQRQQQSRNRGGRGPGIHKGTEGVQQAAAGRQAGMTETWRRERGTGAGGKKKRLATVTCTGKSQKMAERIWGIPTAPSVLEILKRVRLWRSYGLTAHLESPPTKFGAPHSREATGDTWVRIA